MSSLPGTRAGVVQCSWAAKRDMKLTHIHSQTGHEADTSMAKRDMKLTHIHSQTGHEADTHPRPNGTWSWHTSTAKRDMKLTHIHSQTGHEADTHPQPNGTWSWHTSTAKRDMKLTHIHSQTGHEADTHPQPNGTWSWHTSTAKRDMKLTHIHSQTGHEADTHPQPNGTWSWHTSTAKRDMKLTHIHSQCATCLPNLVPRTAPGWSAGPVLHGGLPSASPLPPLPEQDKQKETVHTITEISHWLKEATYHLTFMYTETLTWRVFLSKRQKRSNCHQIERYWCLDWQFFIYPHWTPLLHQWYWCLAGGSSFIHTDPTPLLHQWYWCLAGGSSFTCTPYPTPNPAQFSYKKLSHQNSCSH